VSVALQHVEAVSILRHAIVVGEGSSTLDLLSEDPPLSSFNTLLGTGGEFRNLMMSPGGLPLWMVLLSSWTWVLPFLFFVFPPCLGALIYL